METRNIPEDQWIEFCNGFSRDYLNWPATIEVLDGQSGPQKIVENLPFQGISFDTKGSRPSTIEVSAGDKPNRHVTHVVDMPLHICQTEETNGSIDVQIEPARGPVTLIHLRGPIH